MTQRLFIALLAAIGAGVIGVGPAGAGGSTVYSIEGCVHPTPKPTSIVFYCADNGAYADGFDWVDWGQPSAHTSGVIHVKSCDPDCASGPVEDFPVEITLYNIQHSHCGSVEGRFYRNVRLEFPGAQPDFFGHPPRHVDCSRLDIAGRGWDAHCGSDASRVGAGWFHVRADNVSCSIARHVARHQFKTGDRHFNGWNCDPDKVAIETVRVDCARHRQGTHQRVRFFWGA